MNFRTKNAVGISLIIIVALAIAAVVVVSAVDSNRNQNDVDFFIDSAPIDYGSAENFFYVDPFRKALQDYLGGYAPLFSAYFDFSDSDSDSVTQFTDRILNAMSYARVPAYKLRGMATAINDYKIENVLSRLNLGDLGRLEELTDEEIMELMSFSTIGIFGSFLDSFFAESLLTGEEFGNFIYNYIDFYGGGEQRDALQTVGRDRFVALMSGIAYATTAFHGASNGAVTVNGNSFAAAFYQMGSVVLRAEEFGCDVFEKAMGLYFEFENNVRKDELNTLCEPLQGQTGKFVAFLGYVLREIDGETVEANFGESEDDKIIAASRIFDAVLNASEKFALNYGEENVKKWLQDYFANLYNLYIFADNKTDEFDTANSGREIIADFFENADFFKKENISYESLAGIDAETRKRYVEAADSIEKMKGMGDLTFITVLYLWSAMRVDEAKGGNS